MGFDEGRIILNSDTGIYYSGQTVHGKLIFDQEKEKTFRGIYVKLKGFCYVHWRTTHTRRVNGKSETYYVDHTSREEYVNQKTYLVGSPNGECKISPGHYEYPFQLAIPGNCPSSFEGTHGHVRYEVKAVVDRAFKMDQEKKAVVRVIAPLDLNTEPGAKDPVHIKFDETYYCCCSRAGSVTAVAKLPYGGYIPGQTVPVELACDNNGSVTIDSITITLKKDTKFHAQGTKSETAEVAQLQLGAVAAGSSRSFTAELLVPYVDTPNMRQCRYIDVDYRIKVVLSPDGCHTDSSESRGIVVGSIPIVGSNYPSGQDQVAHQDVPVVTQPISHYPGAISPYPGGQTPYPGNAYPSNTPYPGPVVTPYPTANPPYHNGNEHPPPPPPYSVNPSEGAPYPFGPTQYPPSKATSEKTPYQEGPNVTPYPTSNSPYPIPTSTSPYPTSNSTNPTSNSPYPTSTSPYPPSNPTNPTSNPPYPTSTSPYPPSKSTDPTSNSPYPTSTSPYPTSKAPYPTTPSPFPPPSSTPHTDPKPASTGLRTGTFGFIGAPGDNKPTMPQLPVGALPYPMTPPPNPFAAASAPEPSTPDDEKK